MKNFNKEGRGMCACRGVLNTPTPDTPTPNPSIPPDTRTFGTGRMPFAPTCLNKWLPMQCLLMTLCSMLFNLSDAWAQSVETRTAERQDTIRPLQIGDTVPEQLWNLPLQVVNHPEDRDTITLSDYRDKKLIILDFWATWCVPCVRELPKLDSLNRSKPEMAVIPISKESKQKITGFLERVPSLLTFVYDENVLAGHFPHKTVPHQVWIKDNQILAITGTLPDFTKNVEGVMYGADVDFDLKSDIMDYEAINPIGIYANARDARWVSSSFSAYINGLGSATGYTNNGRYQVVNYINISPLLMVRMALDLPFNKLLLKGNAIAQFISNEKDASYCYQLMHPLSWSKKQVERKIRADLENYLHVHFTDSILETDCWVVKKAGNDVPGVDFPKTTDLKRYRLENLIGLLNQHTRWSPDLPVFIDESDFTGTVEVEHYTAFQYSPEALNDYLKQYGLVLMRESRPIRKSIVRVDARPSVLTK